MLFVDIPERTVIYLTEPEEKACHVRVTSQISKILRCHIREIIFGIDQSSIDYRIRLQIVICQPIDNVTPAALIKQRYQGGSLRRQIRTKIVLDRRQHSINKTGSVQARRITA